jgi:hypothetical protein
MHHRRANLRIATKSPVILGNHRRTVRRHDPAITGRVLDLILELIM